MIKTGLKRIVDFLFEIRTLGELPRTHAQMIPATDTVAAHSFFVALIGINLAVLEDVSVEKVMKMALFHDLPEARTGDQNYLHQQYVVADEKRAIEDQLRGLPIKLQNEIRECFKEFHQQKTKEAMVAKDADRLCQILEEQRIPFPNEADRKIWQNHKEKQLQTESAKRLASEIRATNLLEWLYVSIEEKTGERIER